MDFSIPARDLPVSHPIAEAPLCGDVSDIFKGGDARVSDHQLHDGVCVRACVCVCMCVCVCVRARVYSI